MKRSLPVSSLLKSRIATFSFKVIRTYYRYMPLPFGKLFIWNAVVQPYFLWRSFESNVTTRFGARMHVQLPDMIQAHIYFFGVWEPVISAYIAQHLSPGDTFIDIGANIGYDTLLAAHCVGPKGHVHAFEASPSIYRLLDDNIRQNNSTNVSAYNIAVCDGAKVVDVYLHRHGNLGETTIITGLARRRSATLEGSVPGMRLAAVLPEVVILSARLIKIDVEGAEWLVIQGLATLLPRLSARTEILVEVNGDALRRQGTTTEALVKIFQDAGFAAFVLNSTDAVDDYFYPASVLAEPLCDFDFAQRDLLFRRSA